MKTTPEKIYLMEVGLDEIVWCDDPDPGLEMDEQESVEYIRADCVQRPPPCENTCEARAFEIEIRRLKARP